MFLSPGGSSSSFSIPFSIKKEVLHSVQLTPSLMPGLKEKIPVLHDGHRISGMFITLPPFCFFLPLKIKMAMTLDINKWRA